MHWAFDGNFTHRPFPDAFNLDHTYTFPFVSQTGVHNFAMTQPGFLQPGATGMQFDLYLRAEVFDRMPRYALQTPNSPASHVVTREWFCERWRYYGVFDK